MGKGRPRRADLRVGRLQLMFGGSTSGRRISTSDAMPSSSSATSVPRSRPWEKLTSLGISAPSNSCRASRSSAICRSDCARLAWRYRPVVSAWGQRQLGARTRTELALYQGIGLALVL